LANPELKLAGRYSAEAAPAWARGMLDAFRAAFTRAMQADESSVIVAAVEPGNSARSTPLASERMRDRFMAALT